MTTRKAWWDDEDEDDDTEQAVAVSDKEKGDLVPLEEINRKAERGAVLGSVAALISIRALKACQMHETRIEALENVDKPAADAPVMPEIVNIGHYEMKTSELLVLPDETLERLLDCAQETLEDPDFSAAVDELLKGEDLPELVAAEAEAGNDEGE